MPIDVASGNVHFELTDIRVPGKVSLVWDRRYSVALLMSPSASEFGPGWTHRYAVSLRRHVEAFEFATPAGGVERLLDPDGSVERGAIVRNVGAEIEVFAEGDRYIVQTWSGSSGPIQRYGFTRRSGGERLLLKTYEDVTGQGLDLSYDETGRLVTVQQRLERRSLRLVYNTVGRVAAVVLVAADGSQTSLATYEYDRAGRLSAAIDALGYADRYEYDAVGRIVREILKDGGVFSFRYDLDGRCTRMSGLDRYDEKTIRYLPAIGWTEVKNSLGYTTRYQWNASGQVVTAVDPSGAQTKTEYDPLGRIAATILPNGQTTRFEYDENGNRSNTVDPEGQAWTYEFNEQHQPVVFTDPMGRTWRRDYDDHARLVLIENPAGSHTERLFDAAGNLIEVRTGRGTIRRYRYDDRGALIETSDAAGHRTHCVVDAFGRVSEVINASGLRFRVGYDLLGRTTWIEHPDRSTQRFVYDAGGNQIAATDRSGNTRQYRFGPCRRLLEAIDANGQSVRFFWGSEPDRLEEVINEHGESYRFKYDERGHLVEEVAFDGRERRFVRDASGRIIAVVDGDEPVQFQWDRCGRLTERRLPDGAVHRVTYDASGDLVAAATPDRTLSFERDSAGRVVREAQDDHVVSSDYDPEGNRLHMETDLGHVVDFSINSEGRVEELALSTGDVYAFAFNERGFERSRKLPGDLALTTSYDTSSRVAMHRIKEAGQGGTQAHDGTRVIVERTYVYAPNGTLTHVNDSRRGASSYSYDGEQQLLKAIPLDGPGQAFAYDATGNLTEIAAPDERTSLTYSAGNRLLRAGATHYEFDRRGRLIKRTDTTPAGELREWNFMWDALGQLRSVRKPDGDEWVYSYDFFGRRFAKQGPDNQKTAFVWDRDALVHELRDGAPVVSWVYADNRVDPVAKSVGDEVFSVVSDQISRPQELLSRSGRVVWAARPAVWGRDLGSPVNETNCPLRFPGQWVDEETGLHYNRFRYYDPDVARFISEDPIGPRAGLNLYRYAPNPLNWFDLLGLNICQNRQKGEDFKDGVKDQYPQPPFIVHEEVTIKVTTGTNPDGTPTTVRTRVDLVVIDPNGTTHYIETKASATAPYTPNQSAAGVGQSTGTLVGPAEMRSDRPGLTPKGDTLPAGTSVTTVRPGDQLPGLPPGTTAQPVP